MSKCTAKGHVSKAKIIHKAKSGCSTDGARITEGPPDKGLFLIDWPHFIKTFGPKQKQILSLFVPSAITYGITSLIFICYLAEWKAVLRYVPLYRGKYFPREEPEKKTC